MSTALSLYEDDIKRSKGKAAEKLNSIIFTTAD
jgi:hypothetical protein